MKISPLSTCVLITAVATSKNQAEAGLPSRRLITPIARGLATGAISTGIKHIVSGLVQQVNDDTRVESLNLNSPGDVQSKPQRSPSAIVKNAMRDFQLNFGSNAIATACVDKVLGVAKTNAIEDLQQQAFPFVCMGVTQEVLREVKIPQQLKNTISYCAFYAGSVAQGKAPVATGLGIAGYLAGSSLVNHFGRNRNAIANDGVSAAAASGFMARDSGKTPDIATADSYDNYIRQRYGLKPDEKFWAGPDGSIFVPVARP
jgi:hypothetical protein